MMEMERSTATVMAIEGSMATATVMAIEGLTAMEGSTATATTMNWMAMKGVIAMATEIES